MKLVISTITKFGSNVIIPLVAITAFVVFILEFMCMMNMGNKMFVGKEEHRDEGEECRN